MNGIAEALPGNALVIKMSEIESGGGFKKEAILLFFYSFAVSQSQKIRLSSVKIRERRFKIRHTG